MFGRIERLFGPPLQARPGPGSFGTLPALYCARVRQTLVRAGLDAFGENGEAHTLARVWEVPACRALGLGR